MATKEELYERAQELDIEGRSDMNKAELEAAVAEADSDSAPKGASNADRVGDENYAVEAEKDEPDFSNVAPESVSGKMADDGGVVPEDGKVIAPMEDPVGTTVTHREELAAETAGEDDEDSEPVEPLSFEETTTTINGERAASGDPEVTWANIAEARRGAGLPANVDLDADGSTSDDE